MARYWLWAALVVGCGCSSEQPSPPLDAGPPLDATFDEPLLLTVAAGRPRTVYLVDEGYSLAQVEGMLVFDTDTSGTFGVSFSVDGVPSPTVGPRVAYAASDSLVVRGQLMANLEVEHRFLAASSHVAVDEVVLTNRGSRDQPVEVMGWVRRCAQPFTRAAEFLNGVGMAHDDTPEALWQVFGQGTFAEHLLDALVVEGGGAVARVGLADCGASLPDDVGRLFAAAALSEPARLLAVRTTLMVPRNASRVVRVSRAVTQRGGKDSRGGDLAAAGALDVSALVREGQARLARRPTLATLTRSQQLMWQSSYALLDQLVLPAEGALAHPYFLFAREPSWWFSKLGQHVHEGLALIALAQMDPALARAPLRNFFRRMEADGYVPYNLGPVIEQTAARTATAPLLAWLSWQVSQRDQDLAFVADAYAACARFHGFWVIQRDKDRDGLAEWGGYPVTESLRDLENVIWNNVVAPDQVEAVDLNSMLVMEEKALAAMARALGKAEEAASWTQQAQQRADLINAGLWDEAAGFYFHRRYDTNSFDALAPGDLKRLEIAGFLPLWAGIVPEARKARLLAHLTNPKEFWRPGGVPGLAANDPYFDPASSKCCRWRGPVWVPWMYLLELGLLEAGELATARVLVERTALSVTTQLSLTHQFREHYDPDQPRAPNGSMPNYIWSAMVPLMQLELERQR